jgi:hypothetical protein
MSGQLSATIAELSSADAHARIAAATEVYRVGRAPADRATLAWWSDAELASLLFAPNPVITVGVAVHPEAFARIHAAHAKPPLATVPPDQDAAEFELHVGGGVALDVLTTREPGGSGAIARYLAKFGEGVQQVEFQCRTVNRATTILKNRFGIAPVYPENRTGANATRVNFFLVPYSAESKVLIELYELPSTDSPAAAQR